MLDGLPPAATALVALVAVVVGLLAGLGLARAAGRRPDPPAVPHQPPELDRGADEVLAVLRSAVLVTTRSGRVVRASPTALAFGLAREDRVGHPAVERLVLDVAGDGRVRDTEVELPRGPVGSATLVVQLRVARLGQQHVLVLAEDRTEPRRVEATRRDFVVNVSHELKTPVGALTLLAETVADAADDPEAVRRFADRMQVEATRLSALVHEIIQLSRLQVTDPLTSAEPVDVAGVVAEAVDRVGVAATAKGIAVDVGPVPHAVVFGDHDTLVTALRNLLDNAVAYSESGTRVAVGTTVRPTAGLVEVAVVDQGIGIPADAVPRLFERFYRVDPARSRDTGGTGLGLSIVKHVAADHGGDVTVWSVPGQGSTFTLRLPLAAGQDDGRPPRPSEGAHA